MSKRFRQSIVLYGIIFFATTANADWSIYKQANLRNKDNCTLRIDQLNHNPIRIWLILNAPKTGVFSKKLPLYQVDDHAVRDLQADTTVKTNKNKDRWIFWELPDGKNGMNEKLLELINGQSVVFQYYLPDGSIKETHFSLKGIRETVKEILESRKEAL